MPKSLEGKSALKRDSRQAIKKTFTEADNLLDTWIGRPSLAGPTWKPTLYVEADSEFERCSKRRGEALGAPNRQCAHLRLFSLVYYIRGVYARIKDPAVCGILPHLFEHPSKAGEDLASRNPQATRE